MATQLTTTDQGGLPQSPEAERFSLMQRQARLFAQSPLIPAHLRQGTPEQAMANCYIAMTIADRMGEDRMTVMQNIHIVHGTAGFKAQYMIARANSSGVFKDGIDWEISGKGKDLSVTAFATLASTGRRVEITVDMAMAEAEGWTKNSKYKTMPEIMLRYRSGTFLVRMYAPQVMLGYQTVEEREDLVAASLPVAEPITGQALLEQARADGEPSEDLPDDPPADPNTNDRGGPLAEGNASTAHTLTPTLTNIANAADDRELAAIEQDTEAMRETLSPDEEARLDEAFATKRAALREKAAAA